jgi:hypothetical protein
MNKLLAALIVTVLSAGCATNPRLAFDDLNTFRIDCAKKYEQMAFLESQMPTPNERMVAALTRNLIGEFRAALDGKPSEQSRILNREYDAVIKVSLYQLQSYCPDARDTRQQ